MGVPFLFVLAPDGATSRCTTAQHLAQIGEPPARFGHTGQRVSRNTRPEGTYRFAGRVPRTARAAVHAIFV